MAQYAASTERSEPVAAAVANPAPLGLSAFALTTFVLSSINAGWFPVGATNVVVSLALFYGGLGQIIAGWWEFKAGNTFGAVAFSSFGGFWLSYAMILIPGTGILDALVKNNALHPALGIYLLAWAIFTALMFLGTLRANLALMAVFGLLTLTFLALAIGELGGGPSFGVIGGYLGILTALAAWYTALAGILTATKSSFSLPVFPRS